MADIASSRMVIDTLADKFPKHYKQGNILLINADCMDVLAELPDKCTDLACVDPPYGIGEDGKKNHSRDTKNAQSTKFNPKKWDETSMPVEYFHILRDKSKNQVIWGANHFIDRIPYASPCWLVWDKLINGDFADCELAYTSFKTAARKFSYMWNGMLQGDMKNKEKRIHPTQKPVKLYDWIFNNYANPGQLILDTHLGSGSSAISAWYYGCTFIGVELDEEYFDNAVKRFVDSTKQETIF